MQHLKFQGEARGEHNQSSVLNPKFENEKECLIKYNRPKKLQEKYHEILSESYLKQKTLNAVFVTILFIMYVCLFFSTG